MVVISDMKIPESCIKCPFSDGHITGGVLTLNCHTNTGTHMCVPETPQQFYPFFMAVMLEIKENQS